MSLRRDRRGFIFTLDAALGVLVTLVVLAGVARIGGPEQIYHQHGYLRLERYANDTLEVMQLTGALDNVVDLVKHGYPENAENFTRKELLGILPAEVQFKLVIGENRLEVYPSEAADWGTIFTNVQEIATASRIKTFTPLERLRILAWLDDPLDEKFMDELERCTNWEVTRIVYPDNTVEDFWNEVNYGNYDVVFLPDDEVDLATGADEDKMIDLVLFQLEGGRVVAGGKTLFSNSQTAADGIFWRSLGVKWPDGPHQELVGYPEYNYMHIIEVRDVTAPYEVCDQIEYAGENYEQYLYEEIYDPLDRVHVVAQWENSPAGGPTPPWPGIIMRDPLLFISGYGNIGGTSVLFNMRFAQSVMDPDNPKGTRDWITLARRSIGYELVFEPVILYAWRGSVAE